MRFGYLLCGLVAVANVEAQTDGGRCTYAIELLHLQDGSTSFDPHVAQMIDTVENLVSTLKTEYDEFVYGLSSFTDKPLPFLGYGNYANSRAHKMYMDSCYRLHTPMTTDSEKLMAGLQTLWETLGGGNDWPENPLEALIYAANDNVVGWTTPDIEYSSAGRPIVRVALVVTDNVPHMPGDAAAAIARWNEPSVVTDQRSGYTTGGFMAHEFFDSSHQFQEPDRDEYMELADKHVAVMTGQLKPSMSQFVRYQNLVQKFGPKEFQVAEYPGNGTMDCSKVDYPSVEHVAAVLKKNKIIPIFMIAEPQVKAGPIVQACADIKMEPSQECLMHLYSGWAAALGVRAVVHPIDADRPTELMVSALRQMNSLVCQTNPIITIPVTSPVTLSTEPVEGPAGVRTATTGSQGQNTATLIGIGSEESSVVPAVTSSSTSAIELDTTVPGPFATGSLNGTEDANSTEVPQAISTPTVAIVATKGGDNDVAPQPMPTVALISTEDEHGNVVTNPFTVTSTMAPTEHSVLKPLATGTVAGGEISVVPMPFPNMTPAVEYASETGTTTIKQAVRTTITTANSNAVPPVAGSTTGTIVGSVAGAAGGAVALAGALWYKFGGTLLRHGSNALISGEVDVSSPTQGVDREVIEHIGLDMFE